MAKILSKSGDSLADVYDVEGSIAGIDQLQSQDVNLVHELGSTIFSERYGQKVITLTTPAVAQGVNFNVEFTLPPGPTRILGWVLTSDAGSRMQMLNLSIGTTPRSAFVAANDIPFFNWTVNEGVDAEKFARLEIGGVVASVNIYVSTQQIGFAPLASGADQGEVADQLILRGQSSAFGAGTVTVIALVMIGFAQTAGLSSKGLPIPSW